MMNYDHDGCGMVGCGLVLILIVGSWAGAISVIAWVLRNV